MLEVLYVVAGAALCGIVFCVPWILWEHTDKFGKWLGSFGFAGAVIVFTSFIPHNNDHFFWGFVGVYWIIVLILIVKWYIQRRKKQKEARNG